MIKKILFVFLSFVLADDVIGQSVQLIYASENDTAENCTSSTQCFNNEVCFFVEYTPATTGTLTSYTMGFIGNCAGNGPPVLTNSSCVMTDNSNTTDGCVVIDSFLMQVSGNGAFQVTADVPVIVHQVCFQLNSGYNLDLQEDDLSNITANIDSTNGQSYTEFIDYTPQIINNGVCNCFQLTSDSGSPSQIIDCLTPIIPIKYQINNCDTAIISNLPSGITSEIINGVIIIEGAPTHGGAFTSVIQSPGYCDCNPSINQMDVGESVVMIYNKCYKKVEHAIFEYNSGEVIDILGDLITHPDSLSTLNNVQIKLHSGNKWEVKY